MSPHSYEAKEKSEMDEAQRIGDGDEGAIARREARVSMMAVPVSPSVCSASFLKYCAVVCLSDPFVL